MSEPGSLAREVERRMAALEMNAKQLSIAAGLNVTYVRDLLKGRSLNPRHEHLAKLATALGCTIADLTAAAERGAKKGSDRPGQAERAELLEVYDRVSDGGRRMILALARMVEQSPREVKRLGLHS